MKILVVEDEKLLASINALLRRQAGQVNEMIFGNTVLDLSTGMLLCEGMDSSQWFGGNGGFDSLATDAETKQVDIGKAHISVEIDGGKASGSMSDIQAGTFVTITIDGKGNATYVLVPSTSFRGQGTK